MSTECERIRAELIDHLTAFRQEWQVLLDVGRALALAGAPEIGIKDLSEVVQSLAQLDDEIAEVRSSQDVAALRELLAVFRRRNGARR